ncbi:sialidase family protein [Membranihabitans maritimus]|uniref:sialidase family protein n=1 Tax=Membranihabitans maritimus TaxID=2904244 RepID=UPI001F2294BC|nr:exo-alpha-sialidase [Membranihabitans maritimus]
MASYRLKANTITLYLIALSSLLFLGTSCKPSPEPAAKSDPFYSIIFPLQDDHVHGPTLAELPNGDIITSWFQGSGERWADDVRIMGARLNSGDTTWSPVFEMADIEDFPDINPVLFLDPDETLWLFWYPVLANQWETSIPMFRKSMEYSGTGAPEWDWQDIILAKPGDKTERGIQPGDSFVKAVENQLNNYETYMREQLLTEYSVEEKERLWDYWNEYRIKVDSLAKGENMKRKGRIPNSNGYESTELGYPITRRIGWQTKNKPVMTDGKMILPLYSDGLDATIFAISEDRGETWKFSNPVMGGAGIQATILKEAEGGLAAYLRDNGPPPKRIQKTVSKDGGMTWSIARDTDIPNPGSGFDGVTLDNGDWVLVYNDTEEGRHNLTIALSEDEGETWSYKRILENDEQGPDKGTSSHYPSIIQGKDGRIHVIYSYHYKDGTTPAKTIKYANFSAKWIKS